MKQLVLEDLTKRYNDVVAVEDMNVEVADGEFVSLVGPSGCGKSTTLQMVGGLTMPTEGQVYIDGRDVTDFAPKDRNVAMVFQNIALFPHMDVYDNISYGLRLRDLPKAEIDERVEEAVEILQLEGMLDRMPAELSGGQRQRVAIGRAIVRDPDVFLMDEPLANLDAKLRVHMRTELQRIQRELDVTTVYVTHDQEEAMTMSDRIAVMDGGVLQQIAPPEVCYERPANLFVASFIGSPSMNFFDGRVVEGGVETEHLTVDLDTDGLTDVSVDDRVIVGVRPEDVYFAEEEAGSPSNPLAATVDVIEPVGHETFVYLLTRGAGAGVTAEASPRADPDTAGSGEVLVRTDSVGDIAEDDELQVVFDRRNVHLFDAGTSEALVHGIDRPADAAVERP